MKPMKPSELIREYGWVQGKWAGNHVQPQGLENSDNPEECGGFSSQGALIKAAWMDDRLAKEEKVMLHSKWVRLTGDVTRGTSMFGGLGRWNDHSKRTKEQVIAKLEEVGL